MEKGMTIMSRSGARLSWFRWPASPALWNFEWARARERKTDD
jgi:hypothetical protein